MSHLTFSYLFGRSLPILPHLGNSLSPLPACASFAANIDRSGPFKFDDSNDLNPTCPCSDRFLRFGGLRVVVRIIMVSQRITKVPTLERRIAPCSHCPSRAWEKFATHLLLTNFINSRHALQTSYSDVLLRSIIPSFPRRLYLCLSQKRRTYLSHHSHASTARILAHVCNWPHSLWVRANATSSHTSSAPWPDCTCIRTLSEFCHPSTAKGVFVFFARRKDNFWDFLFA